LLRWRPRIDADVLEFHRIEPSLLYLRDERPKNAFVHQNMQVLRNPQSDILWSKAPKLYYWLEDRLFGRYCSIYAVRKDAVDWYKKRYPAIAGRFKFIPTWYDPEVFFPLNANERVRLRKEYGFKDGCKVLVSVGRLDSQKDPILLADAFWEVVKRDHDVRLIFVGDGVLRRDLHEFIIGKGLNERVTLLGLQSANKIARLLQAADLFVLSSAYEGMPMCVLEALGTGLPAVSTDVGEVRRVVKPGINGEIVSERNAQSLCSGITRALESQERLRGKPCTDAVQEYTPETVLRPVYDNYRRLKNGAG
jgi:glycosyltransferase involved in cell wall biosynthesis